jgi:hypothetical protein
MKASKVNALVVVAGLALVVGFFLPWIDLGIGPRASGLDVVRHATDSGFFRWMVLAVPVLGLAMVLTGATGSRHARVVSLATGFVLVGYGVFKTVHTFFAVSGFGLWLVIAAGCAALVVPLLAAKQS